jgi:hypothetical protein
LGAAGTAHLRQDSTGEGLHHDGADRPDATLVRVEGAPPDATGVELDDEPELDPKVRTLIGLLWVARGAPVISDRATPAALQTLLGIKLRRGQLPGRS